jgi:hypothetical protein
VFQIRSGLAAARKDDFLSDLLNWCKEEAVAEVIVLASSSAEERVDKQLAGSQLRYLTTSKDEGEFE